MKCKVMLRFILSVVFMTAVSACSQLTQSGQTNTSSANGAPAGNNKSTVDNPTSGGDARAEVLKAFLLLFTLPSYRMHTVGSDSDGKNSTVTMDYAAPDRYHIAREGDSAAGAKKSDIIAVGSDSWIKAENQPWKKSPLNLSSLKDDQKSWLDKINDKNSEIKSLGTESLEGAPMNVYQISYSVKDEDLEMTYKGTGKVWIGATDRLPHKSEIESQATDAHASKMTTTYDYNTNVKIEPPM